MFVGTLPRVRVEERALAGAFGPEYDDYARSAARCLTSCRRQRSLPGESVVREISSASG